MPEENFINNRYTKGFGGIMWRWPTTFLLIVLICVCPHASEQSKNTSINILVLVPWPDSREYAGWDVGLDLLPGSRIAAEEINNRSDILAPYRINVIEAGHDACGLTEHSLGLKNLVHEAINPTNPSNVVAILGLFCSSNTAALSPTAGRNVSIDLIQLSASYSPLFKKEINRFPHLWRTIQAAEVYAQIIIHLADEYDWRRMAVVSNTENAFYSGIASSVLTQLNDTSRDVVYDGSLVKRVNSFVTQVLSDLIATNARIVFISAESAQVTDLLCGAMRRNMRYPNYLWIIADWTLEFLLMENSNCSAEDLESILEGSILFYYRFIPRTESGDSSSFQMFKEKYWKELMNIRTDYQSTIAALNITVNGNVEYASVLYNQVYAISLALNNSLLKLKANNIRLENYGFGQPDVTNIIEESLRNVSFEGFTSEIKFNKYREVNIPVNVYQVINGNSTIVGVVTDGENITQKFDLQFDDQFDDEIPKYYQTIGPTLTSIMAVCILVLFTLVTMVMGFVLRYRNVRKVKASSVKVSMLMFVACYGLIAEDIVILVLSSVELSSRTYTVLCNLKYVLMYNAFILLFATQLVKQRRIRRIFSKKSLISLSSWRYSNWMLYFKAIGFCLVGDAILLVIVTISIDPPSQHFFNFQEGLSCLKYPYCHSPTVSYYIFYGLYFYLAILLLMNIYMATRAKKTMKQDFRNTKFINLYMVAVFVIISLTIPYREYFFKDNELVLYFNVTLFLSALISAALSQLILFVPILLHALKENNIFQGSLTSFGSISFL